MSTLRWAVRLYIVAVILAGITALALAFPTKATRADDLTVFGVLFLMAAAARFRAVHIGMKVKVTVVDTATFAAALVLGPFLAMLVAGGSSLITIRLGRNIPLYNRLFNAAVSTLSVGAAAASFRWVAGPDLVLLTAPVAIALAALLGYLVNALLVDSVAGLQLRRAPFANWWVRHRADLPVHGALYALGAVAALSIEGHVWALVLFLVPMGLVLVVLGETARMKEQTKAAIIELADLIDRRDTYTYGHSLRVAHYAGRVARRLKMQPAQVDLVTEAARLHDIGKITTPDRVLQKPGPLDADEMAEMHKHCDAGFELLRRMGDFWDGAQLVRCHHERPDGTGYPRALLGTEVAIEASVIAVCDAYDAMTSDRIYRAALPRERVLAELRGGRGTQWHAVTVDALLGMIEEDRRLEESAGALARVSVTT